MPLRLLAMILLGSPLLVADDAIRVMSFNIRYGAARDGDNRWELRRDLVVETIRAFDPDLLGTQETLGMQAEFLRGELPEYGYVGQTRDRDPNGEQCAIFYRKSRFELVSDRQFWLSETPQKQASKSWDSSLPRIVTHVALRDKSKGDTIQFYNTHFDHRGPQARLRSARLLRKTIMRDDAKSNVLVTGDFNCGAGSQPYKVLAEPTQLIDTFAKIHGDGRSNVGTFNGFRGNLKGPRIDWILCSPTFTVLSAEIDRSHRDGRYPSDHFPVTAVVSLKK